MFFKKKPKLHVVPLGYWEEKSYMIIIPKDDKEDLLEGIFDRISKLDGVELLKSHFYAEKNLAEIKISYKDEIYEVNFFPSMFTVPDYYLMPSIMFKKEEIEALKNSRKAITLYMEFHKDARTSYHLELKLAHAMVPNMLGIMDESAERLFSPRWVKMTAESKIAPSSKDLFTVQVVSEDDGRAWLHTHGLCRCGLTELEILDSNREIAESHYNLICTYGMFLIDKKNDENLLKSAYIGRLTNGKPIVVTTKPWIEGLEEYDNIDLGGVKDRKNSHNSKSNIIFLYDSEEAEKEDRVSKISIYNDFWGDNPIYFISDEETARMKELAIEKFDYCLKAFKDKKNRIDIKIGLLVDSKDTFEHIWFELLEVKNSKFKAKLLQEPYDVSDMHTGDEAWYKVENVTDWIIYTPDFAITPSNAFLLDEENEE